ncbi:MAG: hypothetical protein WC985_04640 [Thermoplasmata archaeon]
MEDSEKPESGALRFGSDLGVFLMSVGGLVLILALLALVQVIGIRGVRVQAPIVSILAGLAVTGLVVMSIGLIAFMRGTFRHDRRLFPRNVESAARRTTADQLLQLAAGIFGLSTLALPWFFATSAMTGGYYASQETSPLQAMQTPLGWGMPALSPNCQSGSSCFSESTAEDWATAGLIALVGVGFYVLGCVLILIESVTRVDLLRNTEMPMYIGFLVAVLGIVSFGTRTFPVFLDGTHTLSLGPAYGVFIALLAAFLASSSRGLRAPRPSLSR